MRGTSHRVGCPFIFPLTAPGMLPSRTRLVSAGHVVMSHVGAAVRDLRRWGFGRASPSEHASCAACRSTRSDLARFYPEPAIMLVSDMSIRRHRSQHAEG